MTTTTRSPAPENRLRRRGAFTLVELMVSAGLGALLLAGVLTSFVFIVRGGVNMQHYAEMETEARTALETFGQDVRMAREIVWNSSNSLTLTIPGDTSDSRYTYTYDPVAATFTRTPVSPTSGAARTLITHIQSFAFTAYSIDTGTVSLSNLTSASSMTKQIQISLSSIRTAVTAVDTTNSVISARYVLRNKHVTS